MRRVAIVLLFLRAIVLLVDSPHDLLQGTNVFLPVERLIGNDQRRFAVSVDATQKLHVKRYFSAGPDRR